MVLGELSKIAGGFVTVGGEKLLCDFFGQGNIVPRGTVSLDDQRVLGVQVDGVVTSLAVESSLQRVDHHFTGEHSVAIRGSEQRPAFLRHSLLSVSDESHSVADFVGVQTCAEYGSGEISVVDNILVAEQCAVEKVGSVTHILVGLGVEEIVIHFQQVIQNLAIFGLLILGGVGEQSIESLVGQICGQHGAVEPSVVLIDEGSGLIGRVMTELGGTVSPIVEGLYQLSVAHSLPVSPSGGLSDRRTNSASTGVGGGHSRTVAEEQRQEVLSNLGVKDGKAIPVCAVEHLQQLTSTVANLGLGKESGLTLGQLLAVTVVLVGRLIGIRGVVGTVVAVITVVVEAKIFVHLGGRHFGEFVSIRLCSQFNLFRTAGCVPLFLPLLGFTLDIGDELLHNGNVDLTGTGTGISENLVLRVIQSLNLGEFRDNTVGFVPSLVLNSPTLIRLFNGSLEGCFAALGLHTLDQLVAEVVVCGQITVHNLVVCGSWAITCYNNTLNHVGETTNPTSIFRLDIAVSDNGQKLQTDSLGVVYGLLVAVCAGIVVNGVDHVANLALDGIHGLVSLSFSFSDEIGGFLIERLQACTGVGELSYCSPDTGVLVPIAKLQSLDVEVEILQPKLRSKGAQFIINSKPVAVSERSHGLLLSCHSSFKVGIYLFSSSTGGETVTLLISLILAFIFSRSSGVILSHSALAARASSLMDFSAILVFLLTHIKQSHRSAVLAVPTELFQNSVSRDLK